MCLKAVRFVINHKLYNKLAIPEAFIPFIEKSWYADRPVIYGRFDLRYDGVNPPQMLEFNADTPTSLFEASVVQWFWLQDTFPDQDQFNSIHEKLIAQWTYLKPWYNPGKLYFSCVKENPEDYTTVEYLRDCAIQAGLETGFIYMEDIGYDTDKLIFVDLDGNEIKNLFKLYPWEWMVKEEFGPMLLTEKNNINWTEPPWKMILSNKAILPILWQLFPGHKNLLEAYFEEDIKQKSISDFVKKPKLSREGANIEIYKNSKMIASSGGEYGEEGFIHQKFNPLPEFDSNYPVIGSWIIGNEPAGIGIRESKSLITDNLSRFVPHLINIR